jgi:6-pyruvoyltetrahydropterin/6-carboxytetrahydropterin synthase
MMYVTRRETFNAAHKVYNPEWDEAKNMEVFGGCANPNWHGHNYVLLVTVKGTISKETGFVTDLKLLSQLIKTEIINKVDHKNFNLDVPFMEDIMPSTENVAKAFWGILKQPVADLGCVLHSVKLQETENNYVEYFGEE